MPRSSEGVYPISQVTVKGVYPAAGRRYIVYETMIDSFNNQPAIAVETKDGTVRVKFIFTPVNGTFAPQPSYVLSHYLSDWRAVTSLDQPPVDGADEPRLRFAEIPVSGTVVIADERGQEHTVAR